MPCSVDSMSNWVEGRERFIGHCGDHDPGGLIISDSLRSNLLDMAGATAKTLEVDVEEIEAMIDYIGIERFGLNADFIDANNLTWIDNLETSSGRRLDGDRHPDHYKPMSRTTFAGLARRRVKPMRWWSRRRPVAGCVEIGSCSTLNRTPQGSIARACIRSGIS